jgi:hypothetical protein
VSGGTELVQPLSRAGDGGFTYIQDAKGVEDKDIHLWRDIEKGVDIHCARYELRSWKSMPHG